MALRDVLPPLHLTPAGARVPVWKRRLCATPAGETPRKKPFAVLDIETGKAGDADALGGSFVIAALRCWDRDVIWVYHTAADLLRAVLAKSFRGYIIYAHNGAGYDFKYLLEAFKMCAHEYPSVQVDILLRGDGRPLVIRFRLGNAKKYHVVTLHDTFHFLPVSLEKAARTFAPELAKLEHDWTEGLWFSPDSAQDMAYLRRDVDALWAIVVRYRALILDTFGVNLRITASATARAAWQRTLEPETVYWRLSPNVEEFTREAAHGGLIGLTTTVPQTFVGQADKHAHYADGMRQGVPGGVAAWTDRYIDGQPGCYECDVRVPLDERYPFVFAPHQGVRRGAFRTYLYSHEVEWASQLAYDVRVRRGVVWDALIYPFDTFLALCERLELEHRGDAIGACAKMLRNSLSGVFDKRPQSDRIVWTPGGTLPDMVTPLVDETTGDILDGLGILREKLDAAYMHPEWYGYHTATARIITNKLCRTTRAVYWDTDCAVAASAEWLTHPEWFGPRYGQLAIEAEYSVFRSGGPKNIYGILVSGDERSRLKGLPKRVYDSHAHVDSLNGETVSAEYVSVAGAKDVLRGHEMQLWRTRTYAQLKRSSTWEAHDDGSVWARVA